MRPTLWTAATPSVEHPTAYEGPGFWCNAFTWGGARGGTQWLLVCHGQLQPTFRLKGVQ